MTIKGVIFDLGHTLMHLDGTWPEVMARGTRDLAAYLQGQGLTLDGAAFGQQLLERRAEGFALAKESLQEVTAEASMRWTLARFGLDDPDPALVQGAIDAFFAYEESRWMADPQTLPLLRELAGRGLRLGIFSNATDDRYIQRLVDRFGFRPWLDPVWTSAGTGLRKPHPGTLTAMVEHWGLPARAVAMVGDTLDADILAAQRAGLKAVWICSREDARQEGDGYDQSLRSDSVEPQAVISHLAELPECLGTWSEAG